MHLIYITFPSKDEAIKIARQLVQAKLVACANIYNGVTSIYAWEGAIQENEEVTLICKAADTQVDKIIQEVNNLHSNECPCIISIKISKGNKNFLKWVDNCSKVDY